MITVLQRVQHAKVEIDGKTVGATEQGLLILLGVAEGDTRVEADKLVKKIANLRIFEDENGKMNLSLLDIGGGVLVVSQFTLCADCTHGRRPSFTRSAPPAQANELYEYFTRALGEQGVSHVETGVFGADMAVTLLNDGPVTIILAEQLLPGYGRSQRPQCPGGLHGIQRQDERFYRRRQVGLYSADPRPF